MKFLIPVGLALALTACGPTKEQQDQSFAYAKSKLPEGCNLGYVGNVKVENQFSESRIFFVTCGDITTTSETHEVRVGKNTETVNDITVTQN